MKLPVGLPFSVFLTRIIEGKNDGCDEFANNVNTSLRESESITILRYGHVVFRRKLQTYNMYLLQDLMLDVMGCRKRIIIFMEKIAIRSVKTLAMIPTRCNLEILPFQIRLYSLLFFEWWQPCQEFRHQELPSICTLHRTSIFRNSRLNRLSCTRKNCYNP